MVFDYSKSKWIPVRNNTKERLILFKLKNRLDSFDACINILLDSKEVKK